MAKSKSLKARYESRIADRHIFLQRAIDASRLTLPTLVPEVGHNAATEFYQPYQSVGGDGVNNLAAKLLLSLLPPNTNFFRLRVGEYEADKLAGDPDKKALIEAGLAKIERAVQTEIEMSNMRSTMYNLLRHLIVAGNVVAILPAESPMHLYTLHNYVTVRDCYGTMLETITFETIARSSASDDVLSLLDDTSDGDDDDKKGSDNDKDDDIEVYTIYYLKDKKIYSYQEIGNGKRVPNSEGNWPADKSPILVLRWNAVPGESYGRGRAEELLGDLISLEGLRKAIFQAAACTAKVVYLLNPNGTINQDDFAEAESGDIIEGMPNDIHAFQAEKQMDIQVAQSSAQYLEQRLSMAFLMNSSVQRNAERVTATEVSAMIQELEQSLGGVFSQLSSELQLPFIARLMSRMTAEKKIPALPKGVVNPTITTGIDALGRGNDLTKLQQFIQAIALIPPQLGSIVNIDEIVTRTATALGISPEGLIKTPEQKQQEAMEAQQAQMRQAMMEAAKSAAPNIVKGASDMIQANGQQNTQEQPQQ